MTPGQRLSWISGEAIIPVVAASITKPSEVVVVSEKDEVGSRRFLGLFKPPVKLMHISSLASIPSFRKKTVAVWESTEKVTSAST